MTVSGRKVVLAWAGAVALLLVFRALVGWITGGPIALDVFVAAWVAVSLGPAVLTFRWARTRSEEDSPDDRIGPR